MYERLEKCPSCQHLQFDNFLICEDHSVTRESFALVKCRNCNLVFTNPRPDSVELGKYYQSDNYISHTDKAKTPIQLIYKLVRSYTLRKKSKLIQPYKSAGMVLDYGCGTGDFLRMLESKGWSTIGIEPDEGARRLAKRKVSGSIVDSLKKIESDTKFDVITAWHVVEHISDLKETLKLIRKKLKKGGHLVVAVPNLNSFDATHYREYWAAYDVPRHLYHFSQDSFLALANGLKLKVKKILPMKFDSYYVSMLSEKYRSGKNNFIKGFLMGMKSNSKASKSGEYSSLIYILKK